MENGLKLNRNIGKTMTIRSPSGGNIYLTPESQALTLRWPWGGFVWNRPSAITVEKDGSIQRLPIIDVTRLIQLGLIGFSLTLGLITLLNSIRRRSDPNER
jgi:hypothetical protein